MRKDEPVQVELPCFTETFVAYRQDKQNRKAGRDRIGQQIIPPRSSPGTRPSFLDVVLNKSTWEDEARGTHVTDTSPRIDPPRRQRRWRVSVRVLAYPREKFVFSKHEIVFCDLGGLNASSRRRLRDSIALPMSESGWKPAPCYAFRYVLCFACWFSGWTSERVGRETGREWLRGWMYYTGLNETSFCLMNMVVDRRTVNSTLLISLMLLQLIARGKYC